MGSWMEKEDTARFHQVDVDRIFDLTPISLGYEQK